MLPGRSHFVTAPQLRGRGLRLLSDDAVGDAQVVIQTELENSDIPGVDDFVVALRDLGFLDERSQRAHGGRAGAFDGPHDRFVEGFEGAVAVHSGISLGKWCLYTTTLFSKCKHL